MQEVRKMSLLEKAIKDAKKQATYLALVEELNAVLPKELQEPSRVVEMVQPPILVYNVKTLFDVAIIAGHLQPEQSTVLEAEMNTATFKWLWAPGNDKIYNVWVEVDNPDFVKVTARKAIKYWYEPKLEFDAEKWGMPKPTKIDLMFWQNYGGNEFPPTYKIVWKYDEWPLDEVDSPE